VTRVYPTSQRRDVGHPAELLNRFDPSGRLICRELPHPTFGRVGHPGLVVMSGVRRGGTPGCRVVGARLRPGETAGPSTMFGAYAPNFAQDDKSSSCLRSLSMRVDSTVRCQVLVRLATRKKPTKRAMAGTASTGMARRRPARICGAEPAVVSRHMLQPCARAAGALHSNNAVMESGRA
jgi:hypothetical protein